MTIKNKKIITICGALVSVLLSIYISPIFILLTVMAFVYFSNLENREVSRIIISRFNKNENLYFEDFIISKENNWSFKDDKFIKESKFVDLGSLITDYKVNNRNYI